MSERAGGASAMVTAELERHWSVANADTVDGADVPKIAGLVGPRRSSRKRLGKKRQVNYVDAPQDVLHRFGIDLAQWVRRENCA
jgi:hypothetical protein